MKTVHPNLFRLFTMLCVVTLIYSCSSDDDSSSEPTTLELLTTGKWYTESKTQGSYSACDKNSYFDFKTNGNVSFEVFDDSSGLCVLSASIMTTYTLDGVNIDIDLTQDSLIGVIDITSDILTVTTSDGDSITFDKIQG